MFGKYILISFVFNTVLEWGTHIYDSLD
jgi:hypothetical protein